MRQERGLGVSSVLVTLPAQEIMPVKSAFFAPMSVPNVKSPTIRLEIHANFKHKVFFIVFSCVLKLSRHRNTNEKTGPPFHLQIYICHPADGVWIDWEIPKPCPQSKF